MHTRKYHVNVAALGRSKLNVRKVKGKRMREAVFGDYFLFKLRNFLSSVPTFTWMCTTARDSQTVTWTAFGEDHPLLVQSLVEATTG